MNRTPSSFAEALRRRMAVSPVWHTKAGRNQNMIYIYPSQKTEQRLRLSVAEFTSAQRVSSGATKGREAKQI
jgi:hypothetical protein